MKQKNQRKIRVLDVFLLILFLSAIVLVVYDIYRLTTEGGQCMRSPINYQIRKVNDKYIKEGNKFTCSCSFSGSMGSVRYDGEKVETFKIDISLFNISE